MATFADIEAAVKTVLLADGTLTALATSGIFHLKAPQDTQPPFVLYRLTEDAAGSQPFAADALIQTALECIAFTSAGTGDADDARAISDRVRVLLNRQDITTGSLVKCQMGARGYGLLDFNQDIITCTLVYDVWAQ